MKRANLIARAAKRKFFLEFTKSENYMQIDSRDNWEWNKYYAKTLYSRYDNK